MISAIIMMRTRAILKMMEIIRVFDDYLTIHNLQYQL